MTPNRNRNRLPSTSRVLGRAGRGGVRVALSSALDKVPTLGPTIGWHVLKSTFGDALTVAFAELRIVRRMVRMWVFAALAVGIGLYVYHDRSVIHSFMGLVAAPRFALPGFGTVVLWILLVGLVFLAFDVRARDERERVADALDCRPLSNVALLGGRLMAFTLAAWLPLAGLAVALQLGGMVVESLGSRLGIPLELVSLATFIFLDAPVVLVFWSALVVLLAAVLRNRLAVAVVAIGLMGLQLWAWFQTPLYLLPALSGISNLGLPGSDILPRHATAVDLVQRGSVLLLGAGVLGVAALSLHRRDGIPKLRGLATSALLLAIGVCGIGALVWSAIDARNERVAWARAHEAALDLPVADLQRMSGTVSVDPGRQLAINVDLELALPRPGIDELVFSLNPDMAVESVRLDGRETPFSHALGLLSVAPPPALAPGSETTLSVRAAGVPDPRFGYLDSAVWALGETLMGMPIVLLGEQASLFERGYVALTPAVRWLPMPGPNLGVEDARRAPDFHDIDLAVEVPRGWRAAGPGRIDKDGELVFRPRVPLAQFPLFAAPFARRSLTVGDVKYELLIHPKHIASVDYFSGASEERTVAFLKQRLGWSAVPGLPYPLDVLSVVEVPAQLRRYGGGRIMNTIQALPGVQMLPEHGVPTQRFPRPPRNYSDQQWFQQMLYSLPISGPHRIAPAAGAPRNLVPFLTSASEAGAVAVNYLVESLTSWVRLESHTVAPAHWLQPGRLAGGQRFPHGVLHRLMGTATFSFGWYPFFPMRLEERSAEISFADIDSSASQEAADIIIHKGNMVAAAIKGLMGRDKVVEFLALLRQRHGGGTFVLDDFIVAMAEIDPAIASYVEHLMRESSLPGFLVSDLRVVRLPDLENGEPRYQVSVQVRNDEAAPGVAVIQYRVPRTGGAFVFGFRSGRPVHVPGNTSMELGVTVPAPPLEVRVETYLSQNARVMRLALPRVDPESTTQKPFNGARASDWQPTNTGIVVDDLDPGFSFVSPPERGFRIGLWSDSDEDMTAPEYDSAISAPGWHRQGDAQTTAWGKYRRTLMRIPAGRGEGIARFATALPTAGRWRLSYHLPGASASEGRDRALGITPMVDDFGTYNLLIVGGTEARPASFDAREAVPGWNVIGTYDMTKGRVSVEVSDATDGDVVVADAIRWQLATREAQARLD